MDCLFFEYNPTPHTCQLFIGRYSGTYSAHLAHENLFGLTARLQIEKISSMKDESILNLLEETAEKLSIKLGYDDLRKGVVATPGGIFVLRGEKRILIHKGLTVKEKIDVLTDILSDVDTEAVHLPPDVRERLDRKVEHKRG